MLGEKSQILRKQGQQQKLATYENVKATQPPPPVNSSTNKITVKWADDRPSILGFRRAALPQILTFFCLKTKFISRKNDKIAKMELILLF